MIVTTWKPGESISFRRSFSRADKCVTWNCSREVRGRMIECVLESRTATYIEAEGARAATSFALSFRQHSIYIFFLLPDLSPWGWNVTAFSILAQFPSRPRTFIPCKLAFHCVWFRRFTVAYRVSWILENREEWIIVDTIFILMDELEREREVEEKLMKRRIRKGTKSRRTGKKRK